MTPLLNRRVLHSALLWIPVLFSHLHPVQAQEVKTALDSVIMHLNLKEVVVKAEKIKQSGDTISFLAASYINKTDKSLEDLLRKMPGIKVTDDGQIIYNGQWIKEFYIEGMDMLSDNYKVATKNIDAQSIGSVQLMENHQGVKLLQGVKRGTSPAINIKLKDSAKGVWSSTISAAAGSQPKCSYETAATLMNFRRTTQNISVVKANNVGTDLRQEIGAPTTFDSSIGTNILTAEKPNLPDKYAYRNNSQSASVNQLIKIDEDKMLTFNLNYLYDKEQRESNDETTYLSDSLARYVVNESNTAVSHQHFIGAHAVYKQNGHKTYVKNSLVFGASFPKGEGVISRRIFQKLTGHNIKIDDNLSINYKKRRGGIADASLHIGYTDKDAMLRLIDTDFQQMINQRSIKGDGVWSLVATRIPYFMFNLNLGFNAECNQIETALQNRLMTDDGRQKTGQIASYISPKILWHYGQRFQWLFYVPVGVTLFNSDDGEWNYSKAMLMVKPYSNITFKPSDKLSFDLTAICDESTPSALSLMAGKRYTNYRTTISNPAHLEIKLNHTLKTTFNIGYKNVLDMLFGNLSLAYVQSHSGYSTNYTISDDEINHILLPVSTDSRIWQADQTFSKGFFRWNSKLSESVSAGIDKSEYYIKEAKHEGQMNYLRATIAYVAKLAHWISFETSNECSVSKTFTDGVAADKIYHTFTNATSFSLSPFQQLSIMPSVMYYRNNYSTSYQNNVFLNCNAEYTIGSITLSLNCSNLLDNNVFRRYTDNGIVRYNSEYQLRGRTIMFGLRMKI